MLIHTGQHYDVEMNDRLFADLELPAPDLNLEVGSGTHAVQTAEIMRRFEPVLDEIAAQLRDRRRRRQFDARLQPGREQEAHSGRPCRSRTAELRPHDARRDQPRTDRPDRRPAVHDRADRCGESRARRHRPRARTLRRQRDDRFAVAPPAPGDRPDRHAGERGAGGRLRRPASSTSASSPCTVRRTSTRSLRCARR